MFKNPFKTKESEQIEDKQPNSLCLGTSLDDGIKQYINIPKAFGHTHISGQLGSGAKSLSLNLAEEQIENDGGLVYLDIQGGTETLNRLYEKAKSRNRIDDLLIIDIQHPEKSNTYNPLKNGNPAEITQKLTCFLEQVEMKSPQIPNDSEQINQIYSIALELEELGETASINAFHKHLTEEQSKNLSEMNKELLEAFLAHYGACHQTLNNICFNAESDVDFVDVIKNKKIVYINLNAFSDKVSAKTLSQLITLDLRACLEAVGGDFKLKADQPFIFFSNDCLNLMDHFWARLYAYANPSTFQMIHTNQEPLESILNEEHNAFQYKELIIGNTEHRIYFKMATDSPSNEIISDSYGFLVQATINTSTKEVKEHSKTRILPLEMLESLNVAEALHFKTNALQAKIRI